MAKYIVNNRALCIIGRLPTLPDAESMWLKYSIRLWGSSDAELNTESNHGLGICSRYTIPNLILSVDPVIRAISPID